MISVVTEAPLSGRARVVISKVFSKVRPVDEFNWLSLGDEIPPSDVIIAMTNYDNRVFRALSDQTIPITKVRGYRFETANGPVVPTFSPWLVGRGKMNLLPVVIWDVLTALKEKDLPPVQFPYDDLTLVPSPSGFEEWCREAKHSSFLVHDIETPYSKKQDSDEDDEDPSFTILRFSLARDDFKAITAPFQEPFISLWKELANEKMDKVGWNSDTFDDPREEANGIHSRGRRIDVQWLAHFLMPTIPRGLGFRTTFYDRVPEWKSLGSDQSSVSADLYSAMDARETAKCYVGIREALRKRHV